MELHCSDLHPRTSATCSGDDNAVASSHLLWHLCQGHTSPGSSQATVEYNRGTRSSPLPLWDSSNFCSGAALIWPGLYQNCSERLFLPDTSSFPLHVHRCQTCITYMLQFPPSLSFIIIPPKGCLYILSCHLLLKRPHLAQST